MGAAQTIDTSTHIVRRPEVLGSVPGLEGLRRGARVDASGWRASAVFGWERDGILTPLPLGSEADEAAKAKARERRAKADEAAREAARNSAAAVAERKRRLGAALEAVHIARAGVVGLIPDADMVSLAGNLVRLARHTLGELEAERPQRKAEIDSARARLTHTEAAEQAIVAARKELGAAQRAQQEGQ